MSTVVQRVVCIYYLLNSQTLLDAHNLSFCQSLSESVCAEFLKKLRMDSTKLWKLGLPRWR